MRRLSLLMRSALTNVGGIATHFTFSLKRKQVLGGQA